MPSPPRLDGSLDMATASLNFSRLRYDGPTNPAAPAATLEPRLQSQLAHLVESVQQFSRPGNSPVFAVAAWLRQLPFASPLMAVFQAGMTLGVQGVQAAQAAQTAVMRMLSQLMAPAVGLLSAMASYFNGFKKDRDEERTRRGHDDYPHSDSFTRRPVEAAMGSGGHGGGADQR